MNILHPDITEYLLSVAPERDTVLQEMEDFAEAHDFPIIGPLCGRLLYSYATMINARRVLELGSGYGYSAFWFAKAMGPGGRIICTDSDEENASRAKGYFRKGRIADRIDYRVGNALELIDEVEGEFDIILNDIDKQDYPRVPRKAYPLLRKGGLLITDNVLWSGRIFNSKPDRRTAGILTYNRLVCASTRFFTTIVPLRDGVAVSIKL